MPRAVNPSDLPEIGQALRKSHTKAAKADRTGQSYSEWRADAATQMAAAWILNVVFVRFLEDNRLIDPPRVAGPGDQMARAADEQEIYFRTSPTHTDRDYLLQVFDDLTRLPGDVFGDHNPVRELPAWLSGDAAGEILRFFRKVMRAPAI